MTDEALRIAIEEIERRAKIEVLEALLEDSPEHECYWYDVINEHIAKLQQLKNTSAEPDHSPLT